MNRCFDISFSLLGIAVLLPVMALLAVLVKITSPGPVLFRQIRVGRGGKDFTLFKFRSMTVKPEAEKGAFEPGNLQRVTAIGRLLRSAKLDELPQLFNVLRGDMSLVGPRPEVRKWVDAYPERWAKVLVVRPGITDPASILFRNEEKILAQSDDPERTYREEILPRKLDIYEQYVANRSAFSDLIILIQTVLAVLFSYRSARK
jgi:lipopolysaccharide/colanic/teichoic acid biosynthesis glycosyltransferase